MSSKKPCENKTVIPHGFFPYASSISLLSGLSTRFCHSETIINPRPHHRHLNKIRSLRIISSTITFSFYCYFSSELSSSLKISASSCSTVKSSHDTIRHFFHSIWHCFCFIRRFTATIRHFNGVVKIANALDG